MVRTGFWYRSTIYLTESLAINVEACGNQFTITRAVCMVAGSSYPVEAAEKSER